ncbi:MAG: PatB family C-S lyase [Anaeromyxobacteraceae bacterium]|nr:PatB family C-S lyase [Anaeromyxobacteraceae bacterium]
MAHDFDHAPDRRGTDSIKWGRYAGRDVLPLWVADMDFAVAPAVEEALARRVAHGVFGYASPWPSLVEAVQAHLAREYGWAIEPAWLVWLPGLVTGLNVATRATGGAAFTATPVYPPFLSAAERVVTAPLRLDGARWTWDLPAVEAALPRDARLFMLCHPHNPVGRAWDEAELLAIDELAARRNLVVCSDEIHCGLVLDEGRRHRPYATLSPEAARRSITLMAPSKTFNLPGLGCAFAVIPDLPLRRAFKQAMAGIVPHVNVLGLVACEAALRHAGDWHRDLLAYLRGNRDRVAAAVGAMPGLRTTPVEATYLAWIDARGAGLPHPQRHFEAAGVGLSDGRDFGPGDACQGWVRLNFGCTRAVLDEALRRMRAALP